MYLHIEHVLQKSKTALYPLNKHHDIYSEFDKVQTFKLLWVISLTNTCSFSFF